MRKARGNGSQQEGSVAQGKKMRAENFWRGERGIIQDTHPEKENGVG